jgi:hypothetical protein
MNGNGYPLSNNESELSQMAKEVASLGQQSLYVGAIVKF